MPLRVLAVTALLASSCGRASGGVVDRLEDGRAVVVAPDGTAREVLLEDLPPGAAEGDWLVGGRTHARARARRLARLARTRAALAAGDRGGVVAL